MKRRGHTLIELMISISILMSILGVISMMITSYYNVYKTGMEYNETTGRARTYFAYLMKDITPSDEAPGTYGDTTGKDNHLLVKVSSLEDEITIKRGWKQGRKDEFIRYSLSSNEVRRLEYAATDNPDNLTGSIIIRGIDGIHIKFYESSEKPSGKITDKLSYEEITEKDDDGFILIGTESEDNIPKQNFHAELFLSETGSGEDTFRSYSLRFPSDTGSEENSDDSPFGEAVTTPRTLILNNESYISKTYSGVIPVNFIERNTANGKSCRELASGGADVNCSLSSEFPPSIQLPSINFNTLKGNVNVNKWERSIYPGGYNKIQIKNGGTAVFKSGVYLIDELILKSNSEIEVQGNVKIYVNSISMSAGASINDDGEPSDLLLVAMNNPVVFRSNTEFNGFLYSDSTITTEAEFEGAARSTSDITLKNQSSIEYDRCGAVKFNTDHLEIVDKLDW